MIFEIKGELNMPSISIIVISYNSERTISETLKSIDNQIYRNFEVIISDDASNDRTIEIVQIWKKRNQNIKNIKFFHQYLEK